MTNYDPADSIGTWVPGSNAGVGYRVYLEQVDPEPTPVLPGAQMRSNADLYGQPGYVSFNKLYKRGDKSLVDTMKRIPITTDGRPQKLLLDNDLYYLTDDLLAVQDTNTSRASAPSYQGVRFAHAQILPNCAGIIGSDDTHITVRPAKGIKRNTAPGDNILAMIAAQPSTAGARAVVELASFHLEGVDLSTLADSIAFRARRPYGTSTSSEGEGVADTQAPPDYHGLYLYWCGPGTVVRDIAIHGVDASRGVPPQETFGINLSQCEGTADNPIRVQRISSSGKRSNGEWVGGAGIGGNKSRHVVVEDCHITEVRGGMCMPLWNCDQWTVRRSTFDRTNRGPVFVETALVEAGITSASVKAAQRYGDAYKTTAVNIEQGTGFVFEDCTFIRQYGLHANDQACHVSHNSDSQQTGTQNGTLELRDCSYKVGRVVVDPVTGKRTETAVDEPRVRVERWTLSPVSRQTMVTPAKIVRGGKDVTATELNWIGKP